MWSSTRFVPFWTTGEMATSALFMAAFLAIRGTQHQRTHNTYSMSLHSPVSCWNSACLWASPKTMCASFPPSLCPSPPNNSSSSPPMNAAWCLGGKWTFALGWWRWGGTFLPKAGGRPKWGGGGGKWRGGCWLEGSSSSSSLESECNVATLSRWSGSCSSVSMASPESSDILNFWPWCGGYWLLPDPPPNVWPPLLNTPWASRWWELGGKWVETSGCFLTKTSFVALAGCLLTAPLWGSSHSIFTSACSSVFLLAVAVPVAWELITRETEGHRPRDWRVDRASSGVNSWWGNGCSKWKRRELNTQMHVNRGSLTSIRDDNLLDLVWKSFQSSICNLSNKICQTLNDLFSCTVLTWYSKWDATQHFYLMSYQVFSEEWCLPVFHCPAIGYTLNSPLHLEMFIRLWSPK